MQHVDSFITLYVGHHAVVYNLISNPFSGNKNQAFFGGGVNLAGQLLFFHDLSQRY